MKKYEGGFIGSESSKQINEELRGREAIPLEAALTAQEELIRYLVPPQILKLLPEDKDGVLMEALTNRYMEKYVSAEFNGFADYCNHKSDDKDFIERVKNDKLTNDDFEDMKMFLESHDQEGKFFVSDNEVDNFIKKHLG